MKTTKLILVATLMAIATFGVAQTRSLAPRTELRAEPQRALCITLTAAMYNPGLVSAIYAQVNTSFLAGDQQIYTVTVRYNKNVYLVSGSRNQWINFLRQKPHKIDPVKGA